MSTEVNKLTLPIAGMLSASCATQVERALQEIPGVSKAAVNLAAARATVTFSNGEVAAFDLVSAVQDAGYDVPTENLTLSIDGMSCVSCAVHVEGALSDTSGVVMASVNLSKEQAMVTYIPGLAGLPGFKAAVALIGYQVLEAPDRAG